MSCLNDSGNIVGTEFSIDYLKIKLIEECKCPGELKSWDAEQIAKGLGFLSIIVKVTLNWQSCTQQKCTLPKQVIVKTPMSANFKSLIEDMASEEILNAMFGKEDDDKSPDLLKANFNNEIIALQFFKEKNVRVPRIYMHKTYTNKKEKGFVVMESLADTAITTNMCDGLTIAQVKQLIEELAKMQARAIEDSSWRNKVHGFHEDMIEQWSHTLKSSKAALIAIKPEFGPLASKLDWLMTADSCRRYMPIDINNAMDKNDPKTMMVHGVIHPNNMLFNKNTDGNASDQLAAILDWQIVHVGNVLEDLSRVFFMLNTEDRLNETDNLLKLYHKTLNDNLQGRKNPLTLDWLRRAQKAFLPYTCLLLMMFCPMMPKMPGMCDTEKRLENIVKRTQDMMIECIALHQKYDAIKLFNSL